MNFSLAHITYATELLRFPSPQEIILVRNIVIRVIVLVVDIGISAKAELLLLYMHCVIVQCEEVFVYSSLDEFMYVLDVKLCVTTFLPAVDREWVQFMAIDVRSREFKNVDKIYGLLSIDVIGFKGCIPQRTLVANGLISCQRIIRTLELN
uniref:Uncharacterized protein n=1 Tax=Glossina palpalis gambiensis TaxID=67801 RepID=A0A1B0BKH4_9MUSC